MKPAKGMRLPKCAHPAIRRARRYDVVRITWRDSSRINLGWDSVAAYEKVMHESRGRPEVTAGLIVAVDDAYVMVALSSNRSLGHIAEVMVIPHEAVRDLDIVSRRRRRDIP